MALTTNEHIKYHWIKNLQTLEKKTKFQETGFSHHISANSHTCGNKAITFVRFTDNWGVTLTVCWNRQVQVPIWSLLIVHYYHRLWRLQGLVPISTQIVSLNHLTSKQFCLLSIFAHVLSITLISDSLGQDVRESIFSRPLETWWSRFEGKFWTHWLALSVHLRFVALTGSAWVKGLLDLMGRHLLLSRVLRWVCSLKHKIALSISSVRLQWLKIHFFADSINQVDLQINFFLAKSPSNLALSHSCINAFSYFNNVCAIVVDDGIWVATSCNEFCRCI